MPGPEPVDTPLHDAVRYSDIEDVIEALKDGCDPNQLGAYQWSPLHEACNNGDSEILQLLLKHGGDANMKDSLQGCTSVHYAASQDHVPCLRLLLAAGGLYLIQNDEHQSGLDVAIGECRKLLQAERDKSIVFHPPQPEVLKQNILDDTLASISHKSTHSHTIPHPEFSQATDSQVTSGSKETRVDSGLGDHDSLFDLDEISVDSGSTSSSQYVPRVWGHDGVVNLNSNRDLGHVQLSFEYHAKKSRLKIRVWKVQDLLMPPTETSMIHSIYVKSYLLPDKRKQTKRKTEEIRLENKPKMDDTKTNNNNSEVFKPSSFTFCKSLDYDNVCSTMITERDVALSVCITQKYSRRSYTVATWTLPLGTAIKRMVKEKYTLKPCVSTSIPENMKVYDGSQLQVVRAKSFGSNPSLVHRRAAVNNWAIPDAERSASDSDLNRTTVPKTSDRTRSIEITVPEEVDYELQGALEQIAIMERREVTVEHRVDLDTSLDSSRISLPGLSDAEEQHIQEIRVDPNLQVAHVEVHMPDDQQAAPHTDQRRLRRAPLVAKQRNTGWIETIVTCRPGERSDDELSLPQSETPSWDYYSEPLELSTVNFDPSGGADGTTAQLSMATTFDLPQVHVSNIKYKSQTGRDTDGNLPELSSVSDHEEDQQNIFHL